jgi:hypothetical protein
MRVVPIDDVPAQTLVIDLAGQLSQVNVYQKPSGLYLDLYDAGQTPPAPIVVGVLCEDRNPLVRFSYLGFQGDLAFCDTQGAADPDHTGLGSRFILGYFTAAEVALLPKAGAL